MPNRGVVEIAHNAARSRHTTSLGGKENAANYVGISGKSKSCVADCAFLPVLSYNETLWLAAAITILFVYVRLLMERQKSNRRTLKNPSRHGIINHQQTAIKSLKLQ